MCVSHQPSPRPPEEKVSFLFWPETRSELSVCVCVSSNFGIFNSQGKNSEILPHASSHRATICNLSGPPCDWLFVYFFVTQLINHFCHHSFTTSAAHSLTEVPQLTFFQPICLFDSKISKIVGIQWPVCLQVCHHSGFWWQSRSGISSTRRSAVFLQRNPSGGRRLVNWTTAQIWQMSELHLPSSSWC